jgi:hypothetical protein
MRCLAALVLCLALAPAAAAEPVALMDAPRAADVAVAGGEVFVVRANRGGRVTVDAVAVEGGAVRRLLSAPGRRGGWFHHAQVAASAERIAVIVTFAANDDDRREWRVYSGPPGGPLALDLRLGPKRGTWLPVDVDVDGGRLLVAELRYPRFQTRLRVLEPGAEPVRLLSPGSRPFPPLALAGDHVAFTGERRVSVVDRRSGTTEASLRLGRFESVGDLDLAPDGRLVAEVDGRLLSVAPGTAEAVLPGSAGLALSAPRFAGAGIGALELTPVDAKRPVVFDPGAAAPRVLGTPSTAFGEFAADDRGFAWIANGCVLYAPAGGAPATEPPEGPCPRSEVVFEETDQILHGRRIRIAVTCIAAPAAGCRGSVMLRDGRIAGRGRFSVPAGATQVVDVVLHRSAARRVRRTLKREGDAFLLLAADVPGGRVPNLRGSGIVIDR